MVEAVEGPEVGKDLMSMTFERNYDGDRGNDMVWQEDLF